jgi:hypothetical protein
MDTQNIHNLQEAYLEVYDLDEKSVSWDTGKTASGVSPRDAAARRQAELQSSSNPADKVRASQVGAVRSNMRAAIQQTGTTSPNQLRSAGPIASQRFKNAAIRQRGGSPASVPVRTVPGLKPANQAAQARRGGGSTAQGVGSPSGTTGRFQVGGGQGYGISGIKLADEYDLYDIILSHLLDEGYAETQEQAEVIMVNMGEEWRGSIVEAEVLAKKGGVEGTGTGENWKAKSWTDTEKSRYSSYKKPTAPAAKSSGDSPKAPGSAPARPQQPQSSSQPSQVPAPTSNSRTFKSGYEGKSAIQRKIERLRDDEELDALQQKRNQRWAKNELRPGPSGIRSIADVDADRMRSQGQDWGIDPKETEKSIKIVMDRRRRAAAGEM